jgi:hypothetical protein
METGVVVTLALFMSGVIFQMGRLTARVETVEAWRKEVREDLAWIRVQLVRIETLIQNGQV